MKFHCDRCKTRYSISDDRVRGKILKIRCKNCSAVITVREGMHQTPPARPGAAGPTPAAAGPTAGAARSGLARTVSRAPARPRRVVTPRAASPQPAPLAPRARSGTDGRGALEGAFATAMTEGPREPDPAESISSAPAVLEAEWYLAVDGEQSGPFSLAEAQAWLSRRQPDEEVHCWSEGFDDWLAVEEVVHFGGLRQPARPDPFSEDRTVVGPPPSLLDSPEVTPAPPVVTPAPAPAPAPALARDPKPPVPFGPPVTTTPGVGGIGGFAAARAAAAPGAVIPAAEQTPEPLFAATLAAVAADAPTSIREPGPGNGKFASAELLQMPPAADPVGDMDLDIGEASRVVRLPMPPPGAVPPGGPLPPAGLPGVGRGSGPQGRLGSTGAVPSFDPGVDSPRPELLQPRRRSSMWIPIAAGAGVLAAVAVVLVVLATRESGPDDTYVSRTSLSTDDLARQFTDPTRPPGPGKPEEKATGDEAGEVTQTVRRKPQSPSASRPRDESAAVATARRETGEVDLGVRGGGEPAVIEGYLDVGEIERAYRRSQAEFTRCYEAARKRDPLLEVPKTAARIEVSTAGRVTGVSMPRLAGTVIGNCLTSVIQRWKFPASTRGLSTEITFAFAK